jgi:hypothetical protein
VRFAETREVLKDCIVFLTPGFVRDYRALQQTADCDTSTSQYWICRRNVLA